MGRTTWTFFPSGERPDLAIPTAGPKWHPLVFHSLDVAAVGEYLLARHRGLDEGLSRLLGLPREDAAPLICFLLCLHDIGKFARKFQAKAPEWYPTCFGDDPANLAAHYDHGGGGFRLFEAESDRFNLPAGSGVWRPLISAVTGHHGTPPEPRINESLTTLRSDFGRVGIEAAHQFIQQAHGLFAPPEDLPALDCRRARRAASPPP